MSITYIATNNQEDEDGYMPQFANTTRLKTFKKFSLRSSKTVAPKKDAPNSWQLNSTHSNTPERIK